MVLLPSRLRRGNGTAWPTYKNDSATTEKKERIDAKKAEPEHRALSHGG